MITDNRGLNLRYKQTHTNAADNKQNGTFANDSAHETMTLKILSRADGSTHYKESGSNKFIRKADGSNFELFEFPKTGTRLPIKKGEEEHLEEALKFLA